MNGDQQEILEAHAATAKAVVDRLVSLTVNMESEQWRAKYIAIQDALEDGRIRDAIRENWKLSDYRFGPVWVVSREQSKLLNKALSNISIELKLPNIGRTDVQLDLLPTNVTELGTIEEERERQHQELLDRFQRDPTEEDPRYKEVFEQVEDIVDKKLKQHPNRNGFGFIHVYWETKQQVLKEEFDIDWSTPNELNPDILFD